MTVEVQDIAQGRVALGLAGIEVEGLSDDEIADRCVALMNAMVKFTQAIQPVFDEIADGLAQSFRRLLPLAELIDREESQ